jgi:hypothetical protein
MAIPFPQYQFCARRIAKEIGYSFSGAGAVGANLFWVERIWGQPSNTLMSQAELLRFAITVQGPALKPAA